MCKSKELRCFLGKVGFYERRFMENVQKLCESLCLPMAQPFSSFLSYLSRYFAYVCCVFVWLLRVLHNFMFISLRSVDDGDSEYGDDISGEEQEVADF